MINDPVGLPSLLFQLLTSAIDRLAVENARFKAAKVWMQCLSSSMTMNQVLLEPDASTWGSMPLTILRQENNVMSLLCQGRGKTPKLGGKIVVRKEDPHLDPYIKLTGSELTQRILAGTAEEAIRAICARHLPPSWCPAQTEPWQLGKHSLHQAGQILHQQKGSVLG